MSGITTDPGKRLRQWLYVHGQIDADGQRALLRFETVASSDDLTGPVWGKSYVLASLDATGQTLSSWSFDLLLPNDGDWKSGLPFTAYLPWSADAVAVTLASGGKEILRVNAAGELPEITLVQSPAGGESVTGERKISWKSNAETSDVSYSLWCSSDRGASWKPLSVGIKDTTVAVDFNLLPPSDATMLRVTATAGLRTATADSPAFVIPTIPPSVAIVSPLPGLSVAPGTSLALQARAYMTAAIGGDLPESEAWSWSSDREGPLGIGARLRARLLAAGQHTLSVELKHQAGTATASTTIRIERSVNVSTHVAAADTISNNSTFLALEQPEPSLILHATPVWNPEGRSGVYDNHPIGVWCDGSRWGIFNQDIAVMPAGAAFFITGQTPSAVAFAYRAAAGDVSSNSCFLRHPLLEGDPTVLLLVTAVWNPNGAEGVYNPHPIGVWWDGSRWAVFNQDLAAMPAGAAFNIEVLRASETVFVHRASAASINSNSTWLTHPRLDGQSKARFQCTPIWNPGGKNGIYNPHPIGVWWDGARWAVFNQDLAAMPEGASFIICVDGNGIAK